MNPNLCTAMKENGSRCQALALRGEDLCRTHSKSKKAEESRSRPYRVRTNLELIIILQKELNRVVRNKKANMLQRADQVRKLIELISELKGSGKKKLLVDDGNQKDSFEQKVNRAKKRKDGKR